ncbi:MAG: twin-arginine translocase subunit TatC, partial [Porphyromonas sp.]|nr:twin-arginine translocase subunit TatC [Porphyromonas sp.]
MSGATTSFWDNADILRNVILRVLLYLLVTFLIALIFVPKLFDTVILAPCREDFFTYQILERLALNGGQVKDQFPIQLVNIKLGTQFFLHMRTAFALSVLIVIPALLMEIWCFIYPALYQNEAKHFRFVLVVAPILFYIGVAVGYYLVFPLSLRFLVFYDLSNFIDNQLSVESYMSNFFTLLGA